MKTEQKKLTIAFVLLIGVAGLLFVTILNFKYLSEDIGTFLTFGSVNKAARHFDLSLIRLGEAEELISEQNFTITQDGP